MTPVTITIDDVVYIKADSIFQNEVSNKDLPYMMVRTYSAGVFAGYLAERNGQECRLLRARRIWYWDGASSLSQLATSGTTKPENCKFPCEVSEVILTQVIELIPITSNAKNSINLVKVWEQ